MKFYSEKLKKLFDTEKELNAAETELAEREAKKAEAANQKKVDAQKVEEAFKALNATRKEYNEIYLRLKKNYHDAVILADKVFKEGLKEIEHLLGEKEAAYSKALSEFTKKYNSYHMSLKDGDNITTISRNCETLSTPNSDLLTGLIDLIRRF